MFNHLKTTFENAERQHPDLMERYAARLVEAKTSDEMVEVMRAGLRETFRARFPMPQGLPWPADGNTSASSGHPDSKSIAAPAGPVQSSPLRTQSTADAGTQGEAS